MKKPLLLWAAALGLLAMTATQGAVITVTTTDNSQAGSLLSALNSVHTGDSILFNIPGAGPHYILTPAGGYPLITANNVTVNGYSQPGSAPNTNPILATNNAQIKIVLDSRSGNGHVLDFAGDTPNDNTGYGKKDACILGVMSAKGINIAGLGILAAAAPGQTDDGQDIHMHGIIFAKGGSGHVGGCWIGVDPADGVTLAAPFNGIVGFRYQTKNSGGAVVANILVNDVVVGVKAGSTNAPAEFNVLTGIPGIPVEIEGAGARISGNFFEVFPDGLHDYNPALDDTLAGTPAAASFEGHIEIGRGGDNTLIGTDGDGVNDANERNIFGGVVPKNFGGYTHAIEFYGQTPGTNIVVAGNYFGVGVDGVTRFTNGVPVLNAAGGQAQFRFGSDFDGVSDEVEGNVCFNNWPEQMFIPDGTGGFFDQLANTGIVSARGNVMVNNNPYPTSPVRVVNGSPFLPQYYTGALADTTDLYPHLSTNTSLTRLIGTIPVANTNYPFTIIDLYAADPEGLLFGQLSGAPELPNGYVQGLAYIGSFVEGSAQDLNKTPGAFEFDISKVDLKGSQLIVTANYSKSPAGTHNAITLTSPFSDPVSVVFTPGSVESVGLRHIVPDTVVVNPGMDSLSSWEPYASVLGTSTFLVEANTFAEGSSDSMRFVVALQPAAGGAMKLGEGFYADDGSPFRGAINASRQTGNPGRVAGDKRPGAVNFMVGGEASPHIYPQFQSDNRWTLGFDRRDLGRYATVEAFKLDPSVLTQIPLMKAQDSANGRLTSGTPPGDEISRFGGDLAGLDNGNFVSVVDDRSNVRNPSGHVVVATIFAPDGSIVKDTFKVADGDIWSNVAAFKGGFAVRVSFGTSSIIYFFDDAGNLTGQSSPSASGAAFTTDRGDGTRIASHINSPYVYLAGKVTGATVVRLAVWDARTATFLGITDASEGAFTGDTDRATVTVDALNRVLVSWVSNPAGYEKAQVAARVFKFDGVTKKFTPLTKSFLPFVNQAATGGIHSFQMSVAMTTKQLLVAAKGEINLQNDPAAGVTSPTLIDFYTVISHPDPEEDPTTPAGGGSSAPKLSIATSSNNVVISWTGSGYDLQSAPTVTGAWAKVATTGTSYTTAAAGAAQFYRLKGQ